MKKGYLLVERYNVSPTSLTMHRANIVLYFIKIVVVNVILLGYLLVTLYYEIKMVVFKGKDYLCSWDLRVVTIVNWHVDAVSFVLVHVKSLLKFENIVGNELENKLDNLIYDFFF